MDSRPSDETLLLAVAERDMGAFRTLYERHAGWLAIRLARRCNDRDLVADRGCRGPVRARDRAGPRPGPLRRAGHRPDRPGGRPGLAGQRTGPVAGRPPADPHRPVSERWR